MEIRPNTKPPVVVSREEMMRQWELAGENRQLLQHRMGHPARAWVKTFGCQGNVADSEKIMGLLLDMGCEPAVSEQEADIILYNTCAVRENAEVRLMSMVGELRRLKQKNPTMIVGLCGCMMQQEEVVQQIRRSYPFVELIFGTHVLHSGDVVLMAPFIPYEVRMDPEDGLDMFYLYFEVTPASSLPAFSQLFQCTDAALYPGLIDPALRIVLEQNLDLYQRGTPGQFLSLQLLLTRLMLVMRQRSDGLPAPRRAAQVSNGERVVQECVEYLDEHMRENVQVQDLCKAANVSQSYLYKCFDQVTGMSTREFIRRYRMPQIEMQLRQENLSIQQIAEQNGRTDEAEALYKTVAMRNTSSSLPYQSLARIALRGGKTTTAREYLHQALLRDPRDAEALMLMARLYLDGGEDAELAESLARQSVALRPDRKSGWLELARALEARGLTREARSALLKAEAL